MAEDIFSQSWHRMLARDRTRLIQDVLTHQARLKSAIQALSIHSSAEVSERSNGIGLILQQSAHGLQEFFSSLLATNNFTERHAEGITTEQHRLFGISELVEYMLCFADVADLFRVRLVNKTLRAAIDNSDTLKARMHLCLDSKAHFKTLFHKGNELSNLTGFNAEVLFACSTAILGIDKFPGTYAAALEMRFDQTLLQSPFASKSYPYRAMFICQPPPMEMDVFADCCSKKSYSSTFAACGTDPLWAFFGLGHLQPVAKMASLTGLTIGDLYNAIERVRAEHRLCPNAQNVRNYDDNGNYWPDISFGCLLKLRHDDPILSARVRAGCVAPSPPPPPNWRIWDYIYAKQQAYAAGKPIPTLAEFENSKRVDSRRTSMDGELEVSGQSKAIVPYDQPTDLERIVDDCNNGRFKASFEQRVDPHFGASTEPG